MADVQMDFDLVEDMARIFDQGAQELDEIRTVMLQLADQMEGGALIGEAGNAFSEGLRGPMAQALSKLSEKFVELQRDTYGAMISLRDGDTEAASRFS